MNTASIQNKNNMKVIFCLFYFFLRKEKKLKIDFFLWTTVTHSSQTMLYSLTDPHTHTLLSLFCFVPDQTIGREI